MSRVLHNIVRLPQRTFETLRRHRQKGYDIQKAADRYARKHLSEGRMEELRRVPGRASRSKCRLLFYLASAAPAEGLLVEIGAYKGKSTAWLADAARLAGRHLVSIDPHVEGSLEDFNSTVAKFDIGSVATLHHATSHEIGQGWTDSIAFLWIDGNHEYEFVRQDINDFVPHVQRGGFIALDDFDPERFPGVVQAVHERLLTNPSFEYLGTLKSIAMFRVR